MPIITFGDVSSVLKDYVWRISMTVHSGEIVAWILVSPDTSVGDSIAGIHVAINYVSLVNIQAFFHIDIHRQIFGQNILLRAKM